jgi:UTP:GlnB (protein PII) uridylyltransferase
MCRGDRSVEHFSVASIRRVNDRRMLNEHSINLTCRIIFNKEPVKFLSFYLSKRTHIEQSTHARAWKHMQALSLSLTHTLSLSANRYVWM